MAREERRLGHSDIVDDMGHGMKGEAREHTMDGKRMDDATVDGMHGTTADEDKM